MVCICMNLGVCRGGGLDEGSACIHVLRLRIAFTSPVCSKPIKIFPYSK